MTGAREVRTADEAPPRDSSAVVGSGGGLAWRGAALTLLYLGGGVALTFPTIMLLTGVAPDVTERLGRTLFYLVMATLCAAGGALWGAHLGRLARAPRPAAWARGAALGFGVSAPLATLASSDAETFLLDSAQRGVEYPMHLAFALIFAAVLLVVVGSTSLGLALGAGGGARRAWRLAGVAAGTAVGCFLAVDLAFDLAGWRVGAPGAEQRATMLVVAGASLVAAAAAAGAAVGRALAARREPAPR